MSPRNWTQNCAFPMWPAQRSLLRDSPSVKQSRSARRSRVEHLLTMRSKRQPVAAGGKEIWLVDPVSGLETLERFAPRCPLVFPKGFHPSPPQRGLSFAPAATVRAEIGQPRSPLTPSLTAKGSSSDPLSSRGSAEGMAATNRDDEPLPVRRVVREAVSGSIGGRLLPGFYKCGESRES